ncbi:hypothetical protein ACXR0O_18580 [Verrucomicrobiota bacterium sgz303538]
MSPRRLRGQSRSSAFRFWIFVAVGALVLTVVALLAGKAWIESYLRSDKFRAFVSAKAGETLKAKAEIAPLTLSGQGFYSDGFKAQGTSNSWFSNLQLSQIRADVSSRRFWEHVWQVEQVRVERAQIKLEGERLPEIEPSVKPPSAPSKAPSIFKSWLPTRVEVGSAIIRETEIQWKDGVVSGTSVQVHQQDEGWNITGQGGRLVHGTLPPLDVGSLKLRYREPALFVQDAELRQSPGGTVRVSGEVRMGEAVDLLAKLDGVSMTPYLAGDWRARLHGRMSGEVRVQSPLPARTVPVLSGTLTLSEGQLEALPVLDEIAVFTRTAQFRRIRLTHASGEFRQDGERLTVQNFAAESEGLIRIEGTFSIDHGQIDGSFQVGVTPASLQWLPGSQDRVFTVSRGGYLWTPLRVTGPTEKPREDLSPRLVAAAKGAIIEGAEGAVRDATRTARDAAKSALDLLLGR